MKRDKLLFVLEIMYPLTIAAALLGFTLSIGIALSEEPEPDLFAYGVPSLDYMLRGDFAISFNGMTRCPRWTLEHINARKLIKRSDREGIGFHVDPEIPQEFAASPRDYAGTGWDLGHMAAAANHTASESRLKETFTVANSAPQSPKLNRNRWRSLETAIRATAEQRGVNVWIVTAPLWEPGKKIESIGESKVWIPHRFLKAVLIDDNGTIRLKTWVFPNADTGDPLEDFEVTTDQGEGLVGLNLWERLDDDLERDLEKTK